MRADGSDGACGRVMRAAEASGGVYTSLNGPVACLGLVCLASGPARVCIPPARAAFCAAWDLSRDVGRVRELAA